MKKNFTEMVFVLDKSGSMHGLEKDTIGGFNSMLEKQQKQEGGAYVSSVLFSDRSEVIHDRVAIEEVKPLTEEDYYVGGCTALLDAVGGAVDHIALVHKYAREEDRPEKTIFVIITDGYENASREYRYKDIKKLIEEKKEKYGWDFIFLGANIDASEEADKLGIGRKRAMSYKCCAKDVATNFAAVSACFDAFRCNEKLADEDMDFIRREYKK